MSTYGVREYEGCVQAALELKNKNLWLEFGRPSTPWANEEQPPTPLPNQLDVDTPYLYVKTTYKALVIPITASEYSAADAATVTMIGSGYYKLVADVDAFTNMARTLYMRAAIDVSNGMPAGTFRQVRVYSNLVPAAGYENALWLVPSHVSQTGKREWYDTNPAIICSDALIWTSHVLLTVR